MCHRRPCGFMISQLAYGYDGSIYGCDNAKSFEEFKMGNVKNMTYKALMSTPAYVRLRCGKDIYICDQCVWSPFCGICEVATPSNYNKPTPKVPSSFFCTIRKMMIEYIFKKLLFSSDKSILQSWIN
jgi:radical SAM protein with 4Fe4S-binding SPASM domain